MDEESFHRLEDDCPVHFTENSQEIVDYLQSKGLDLDKIALYIQRRRKGPDWIDDFGPASLHDALKDFQVTTEDLFLCRLKDRLCNNIDPDVNIRVTLPNGQSCSYYVRFIRSITYQFPEDSEDVDVDGQAPSETVLTLSTHQGRIFMPLGELMYQNEHTLFSLVWMVEEGAYYLLAMYYYGRPGTIALDMSADDVIIPPQERTLALPGLGVRMSFGRLSGLNISGTREGALQVLGTEGYSVYPVARHDGKLRPLHRDFSVDTRDG